MHRISEYDLNGGDNSKHQMIIKQLLPKHNIYSNYVEHN